MYLGAFALLVESGLLPSYVLGTSIGSMYGGMFIRALPVDLDGLRGFAHGLTRRQVIGAPRRTRRHGVARLFRLALGPVLSPMLRGPGGGDLRLRDTAIPFALSSTGQ